MKTRAGITIQQNRVVTIRYTLTDEAGGIIESSEGQEPMTYLHGSGNVIPGLEASLEGKSAGESVKVTLPPEDAYGEWDKAQVLDLPKGKFSGVVTVVDVRDATNDELDHGHVHGAGGAH